MTLFFSLLLIGWLGFLGNYAYQDLMAERSRDWGVNALVTAMFGAVALVAVLMVTLVQAGRALIADRREPVTSGKARAGRDLWRIRGGRAGGCVLILGLAVVALARPTADAFHDIRLPDRYWPSGSGFGVQFDVAVEDSQADAEMLDLALNHTASLVGVDIQDDPRNYLRPENCLTPDGDRGTYWEKRLIVGARLDPDKVNAIQEYWRSLGYSILPPPTTAEGSPLSYVEAATNSGGAMWVIHDGFDMYIGFSSGCSSDSDEE